MAHKVCPWWLGYWLICPVRGWLQKPGPILAPYIREGMTVLEPGPGMGFFTLELAKRVGPSGRVVCVDVQQQMLDRLKRRAAKARLLDRLDLRLAPAASMGIADLQGQVDFTLAFAVVHEFPDARKFFCEVAAASKAGRDGTPRRTCRARDERGLRSRNSSCRQLRPRPRVSSEDWPKPRGAAQKAVVRWRTPSRPANRRPTRARPRRPSKLRHGYSTINV